MIDLAIKVDKPKRAGNLCSQAIGFERFGYGKEKTAMDKLRKETPVRYLKGVGETSGARLTKLGVETAGDLLTFFPRRYEYRGETVLVADAPDMDTVATVLTVCSAPKEGRGGAGVSYVKVNACDESGTACLTFFNQPWITKSLVSGRRFRVWGKVRRNGYSFDITAPEIEPYEKDMPAVLPVYPLTKGLAQGLVRRAVRQIVPLFDDIEDSLDEDIIRAYHLMSKSTAYRLLHFPESREAVEAAKYSLAFEELLVFQLALRSVRGNLEKKNAPKMSFRDTGIGRFFSSLPFSLTAAQERVVKEVLGDLCRDVPMCRLVQGDVGSGKTVIAAGAMAFAVKNGLQCAMMAPTEILATQHYETLTKLYADMDIRVELLTGSTSAKRKREIKAALKDGSLMAVVGTNAIIQKDVEYKRLGLVITDEQHRFGVLQRAALADKADGETPHSLVMSATPIPRTMSLILYGDMDVSIIDELPPGRQVIETKVGGEENRAAVYKFLSAQVAKGAQAYIICPLVEDSDGSSDDKKSVESYTARLSKLLPHIKFGMLHGRMSGKAKTAVMEEFERGEVHVLVSTTVVEVGVNVPNATVMLIENAECFGLSQLHQLRGRVGRGNKKSFCILMSEKPTERLSVLSKTNDGFEIANADLAGRGPGDFFGERQSGEACFVHAAHADMRLIEATKLLAESMAQKPLSEKMWRAVRAFFAQSGSENIFN